MITKQNQKSDENITKITQLIKLDNDNLKKQITSVNDNISKKHDILYSNLAKL